MPGSTKTNISSITLDDIDTHSYENYTYYDSEQAIRDYGLTPIESKQLDMRTSDFFEKMNESYRLGFPNPMGKYLSDALKKLPRFDGLVYRGEQYSLPEYNNLYGYVKEGDIITNKAFTSTSTSKNIAERNFAGIDGGKLKNAAEKNVIFTIESKNGKYTLNSAEKEILFDAGTQFKVIKKIDSGPIVEFYLKEI